MISLPFHPPFIPRAEYVAALKIWPLKPSERIENRWMFSTWHVMGRAVLQTNIRLTRGEFETAVAGAIMTGCITSQARISNTFGWTV